MPHASTAAVAPAPDRPFPGRNGIASNAAGTDMTRFPNADHLVSWAGMCPGSNESAGKRRTARTRKGNAMLRAILTQAGQSAGRTKNTYLGATYRRIAARRGRK